MQTYLEYYQQFVILHMNFSHIKFTAVPVPPLCDFGLDSFYIKMECEANFWLLKVSYICKTKIFLENLTKFSNNGLSRLYLLNSNKIFVIRFNNKKISSIFRQQTYHFKITHKHEFRVVGKSGL